MKNLADILAQSKHVIFLGGAGVSTESGIPDFRSEHGVFKALTHCGHKPEILLSHSFFEQNPETFFSFLRTMIYADAKPNAAHYALARLEKQGKLQAVITQNIDGLHQKAGSKKVLELHGSLLRHYCLDCDKRYSLEEALACMDTEGSTIPFCPECAGIIRPDVVLYEEMLDTKVMEQAVAAIKEADTMIVGGTSLVVYPAAGLLSYFEGDNLVLINKTKTPQDRHASLVIHESIGTVLDTAVGD